MSRRIWRRLLVGRLGFEPRQRDSKSLDLPLVDRPAHHRCSLILATDHRIYNTDDITLRTSCPSIRLGTKSPSGKPEPQSLMQPTGRAVEPPLHPPRTGKVQTEQSRNLIAPHKSLGDLHQNHPNHYPSIDA